MTPRSARNLAVSIRQKLLNRARERGEDFQLVLTQYAIERLLYRLSKSDHANEFVLKGAMLFAVWSGKSHRPTRDLDLLGFGSPRSERLEDIFRELCKMSVEDGLAFEATELRSEAIRKPNAYEGFRIRVRAELAGARIPLQVDVGFGDAIVPAPETIEYPVLLDQPAPRVRAYPREAVVAEKFEALVQLGMANTRMKDFYDLWIVASEFEFSGRRLAQAIAATFERRGTPVPGAPPLALTSEFYEDAGKHVQWRAFLRKSALEQAPPSLESVTTRIEAFVMPPSSAIRNDAEFDATWPPNGPWS